MEIADILQADPRWKVCEDKKSKIIDKWGALEGKSIIAAAEKITKNSLSQAADASEIAGLISEYFTTDPTHMSDEVFRAHLDHLAVRAERDFVSRVARLIGIGSQDSSSGSAAGEHIFGGGCSQS